MQEIRAIYQRWLEGGIAQEDALFAIGDILQAMDAADEAAGVGPARPATGELRQTQDS